MNLPLPQRARMGQWLGRRICAVFRLRAAVAVLLLVAMAAVFAGQVRAQVRVQADGSAATGADDESSSGQYLEESDRAEVLLERIGAAFDAGDVETALSFVQALVAIGPEAILPRSGQGVRSALRQLLYGLPPDVRKAYDEALAPAPGDTLQAARLLGTPEAYAKVASAFPGAAAARLAIRTLWATAFESGRFDHAVELVSEYLADPLVGAAERHEALFISGLAAVYAGRRDEAAEALAALKADGAGMVAFGGSQVDPVATLQRHLADRRATDEGWPNVGGTPERTGVAAPGLSVGGPFVFAKEGERDLSAPAMDYVPSRREVLSTRNVAENVPAEHVVLVTAERLLVVRGGRLLALGRLSGERLWHLDMVPSGMRSGFVSWPSCGDGYVAVMRWPYPTSARMGRMRMGFGGPVVNTGRQLVVLHEATGKPAWVWDGSVTDAAADLWSSPLAARGAAAPALVPGLPVGPENLTLPDLQGADFPGAPPPGIAPPGGLVGRGPPAPSPEGVRQLEPIGSPLVYGGRVFVGAIRSPQDTPLADTFLLCFDVADGRLLWQRFIGSGMASMYGGGGSILDRLVPTTDGRRVFAESPAGTLTAIDLATAEVAWARRLPRPAVTSPWRARQATWPNGIADAPLVVGGRLFVTQLDGPAMRCLDAATGKVLWSGVALEGVWRLGVADGRVFVAAETSLAAYDVETGERTFRAAVPQTVTGRGFVASDAVYLPTEAGILRLDWRKPQVTMLYESVRDGGPAMCLAPLADGLVSSHDDRVLVFGPTDTFFAEVERGRAANPENPAWSRRLAELYRQKGDFTEAESLLGEAVRQAARLGETERSRSEQLLAYRRLNWLYRQWAQMLDGQDDRAGAIAKLSLASTYATSPAARIAVWMALAEHYEQAGDPARAAAEYARAAGHSVAQRMFVPTATPGLERSVAAQAGEALERLHSAAGAGATIAGIRREDVGRLAVRRLGMISWSSPSYVVPAKGESLSPLVWSRPDGLVAMGLGREIRWRYTRPQTPQNQLASLAADGNRIFERCPEELNVRRLSDGELVWRWQPGEQRLLAGIDSIFGVNVRRFIRRVQVANGVVQNIMMVRGSPAPQRADFAVTDKHVVVVTCLRTRTSLTVHGLDKATGAGLWQVPLSPARRFAGIAQDGDRVVVVAQGLRNDMEVTCLDVATGRTCWTYDDTSQRQAPQLLFENGLFVLVSGTGRGIVIDSRTGKLQWKSLGEFDFWMGSVPIAVLDDRIILAHGEGYVAVSRDDGTVLWQIRAQLDPAGTGIESGTAATAGGMLIASLGGAVAAIDPSDGRRVWQHVPADAEAAAYRLFVQSGMVVAYESQPKTSSLVFLDVASGKLLGECVLGACGGALTVAPVRGGLFAQNGDEILSVVPAGTAPAPSEPTGGLPGV